MICGLVICLQIYILKYPKYNSVLEWGVQQTKPKQFITMSLPPKTRYFSGWGEYIVPFFCPALYQTATCSWNVIHSPQKEVNHKTSTRLVYNKNNFITFKLRQVNKMMRMRCWKKSMTTGRAKKVASYQRSTNYSPTSAIHCKHCIISWIIIPSDI